METFSHSDTLKINDGLGLLARLIMTCVNELEEEEKPSSVSDIHKKLLSTNVWVNLTIESIDDEIEKLKHLKILFVEHGSNNWKKVP